MATVEGMTPSRIRTEIDQVRWRQGYLDTSSDIDTLDDGVHTVHAGSIATALGLPEGTQGTLTQITLDGSGLYKRQYYRAEPTAGAATEYRRTYYNGNWRDFEEYGSGGSAASSWIRGAVQDDRPVDQLMTRDDQGLWTMSSAQAPNQGMPRTVSYFVEVWSSGLSVLQEATALVSPPERYIRRGYNGSWSMEWHNTSDDIADIKSRVSDLENNPQSVVSGAVDDLAETVRSPTDYKADHYARIEEMRDRIGPVVTGGTAAFALVFDHGTTAVKEWAWEACRARGIPVTMSLCPGVHFGPGTDSNHRATVEDVQGWVDEGMVLASHSWDHDGATGYTHIHRQIVESKRVLEEMFGVPVDSWVQPGYALSTGNYDGFGTGQSASNYTDTFAGQLLQSTYPVITGYVGDEYVYPLSQNPVVGIQRSLIERIGTIDTTKAYIQQAIDTGGKHIAFIHPYALARDSSSTYHTRAEFEGFLDWIVAQRDAGDLQPMTLPELSIAAEDTSTVPDSQTYEPDTGDALALRVDTTVGTRIMAGDHMVSGDTGWRDVSGMLINGWEGNLFVRRDGNIVSYRGRLTASSATNANAWDVSDGFRIGVLRSEAGYDYGTAQVWTEEDLPKIRRISFYFNRFSITGYQPEEIYVIGLTYTSFSPWPTSLPGTPA